MSEGVEQLLAQLVGIDTTSTKPNAPLLDALEPRLTAMGLKCERHRYKDDHGLEKANLLARLGDAEPELALVGHTDCVPFDAGWTDALKLTERDGNLYGRGSCDTKGFVASAVTAFERTKHLLKKPALLCFTADEEVGCLGAKHLVDARLATSKRCLVGEPTQLTPVRANKGYCLAEVEVDGKEGHSAYPETGASAVFRAARLLARLEAWANGPHREELDASFSPPYGTVNVGIIAGGKAKNIIPGQVRFTLEWRPLPSQPTNIVLEQVKALIAQCQENEPGFTARVKPLRMDKGFDTSPSAELVRFMEKVSGKPAQTVSFGTEGPQMQQLGSVPVVFGPGDIRHAHQTGEFVPKADLHGCVSAIERALLHFCG